MTPTEKRFTKEHAWLNGFYELQVELGDPSPGNPSDERFAQASARIWNHPALEGCYLDRDREPEEQEPVNAAENFSNGHLYGIAHLPNGASCVCGTFISRMSSDSRAYLTFYFPMASLEEVLHGEALPYGAVDAWLAQLGRFVFEEVRFDLALIGFEALIPCVTGDLLQLTGVPADRPAGYLFRSENELEWFPPSAELKAKFSLEQDESEATLKCTCCDVGFTSVCGYIRKAGIPYAMYYALIHNRADDPYVRISASVGEWWKHDTFEGRRALCVDVTPVGSERLRLSIQPPSASPQQNVPQFGRWLELSEAADSPLRQNFVDVVLLIAAQDPAVQAALAADK